MKKKNLIVGVGLAIALIGLTGCNNALIGTHSMKDLSEMKDRKEHVEEWLDKSAFISQGGEIDILTKDGMKVLTVDAPPKGTILTHYQDIASNMRDGFFGVATTEPEAQYLQVTGKVCEWVDCGDERNAEIVANRLLDKIREVEIDGLQGKHAVIHRATMYDYDKNEWYEATGEIYVEDLINTANGLLRFAEMYDKPEYTTKAHDLLDTVFELQSNIIANQTNESLHGGLYTLLTAKGDKYVPSYSSYSLALIYELSEIEDALENAHKPLVRRFKDFMNKHLTEDLKVSEKVLFVAVDGNGNYAKDDMQTWNDEKRVNTEKMFKMIAGIGAWYGEHPIVPEFDANTTYTTELSDRGNPIIQNAEYTILPKAMYLRYLHASNAENEEIKEWVFALMAKQKLKGKPEVYGAWLDSTLVGYHNSFEVLKSICEVYTN